MFDFDNCTKYKKDFCTINWQEQKYQGTDFLKYATNKSNRYKFKSSTFVLDLTY